MTLEGSFIISFKSHIVIPTIQISVEGIYFEKDRKH